ncbi:MAG: glycosyl transferase family 2 [Acidobacteria bacterium]|nr:MAG: glycosyl transferase family 2 [Acidobacteriota bacterium]
MISFIVPAYNEEALIGRTLEALNKAANQIGEPYEIVVANDASTDRTASIAELHGARVVAVNRRQIAATRNVGARESIGDRLIFVDADTVVSSEVVRAAIDAMNKGAAGGGSAVSFDGKLPRYAELTLPIMVRVFRATGFACGCFIFCTRRAFDAVGGFDEKLFASEEIAMSRALKRQGRFVVLSESVTSSGRKMRMYSGREVLRLFGTILLAGPKGLRKREGLEVWYGGRREDPGLASD